MTAPTASRTSARFALALASLLLVAACGGDDSADDPTGAASDNPMPTEIPAADGTVHTRGTATVMDTGTPELCLGPIAESYPPQCSGPDIVGWDWDEQKMFETEGDIRWGAYALTGTWDGTAFTVKKAVPAALYDPAAETPSPTPPPLRQYSEGQLAEIAQEVGLLPGVQSTTPTTAQVFADVAYDDGSYQAWADLEYGANTVVINPALVH